MPAVSIQISHVLGSGVANGSGDAPPGVRSKVTPPPLESAGSRRDQYLALVVDCHRLQIGKFRGGDRRQRIEVREGVRAEIVDQCVVLPARERCA